ncbi:hypothetical protein V5O48_011671 [Marasmius crinis-equi]|uniref:Uncharacterized protein n=1 Tax=Marasmius crinis-equi TaxID=585013 RepID=A0ABR3F4Y2_9AGAR
MDSAKSKTPLASDVQDRKATEPILLLCLNPPPPQRTVQNPSEKRSSPAELEYIQPIEWTDTQIIYHLIAHSFDVPSKFKDTKFFCQIARADGSIIKFPKIYRIPLMCVAHFQWLALRFVLSATRNRDSLWRKHKFSTLHMSRLCSMLLDDAQKDFGDADATGTLQVGKIISNKKWNHPVFDRALVRLKLGWFGTKVFDYANNVDESEYEKDVIGQGQLHEAVKDSEEGVREIKAGLSDIVREGIEEAVREAKAAHNALDARHREKANSRLLELIKDTVQSELRNTGESIKNAIRAAVEGSFI